MNFDIPRDIGSYVLELDEFIQREVNQVAIDQPSYSGFKTAIANAG